MQTQTTWSACCHDLLWRKLRLLDVCPGQVGVPGASDDDERSELLGYQFIIIASKLRGWWRRI
jgi:hypothetical protein